MNEAAPSAGPTPRPLLTLVALVVVLAGLKLAAPVLVPIAFALFLAVLSLPLFHRLVERRVPVPISIAVTMLVLFAAVAVFAVLLLVSLGELREVAPAYARTLQERIAYTDEWWQGRGISLRDWIPARWREPQRVAELLGGAIRGTAVFLSETTLIFLLLVFLLLEAAQFPRKLARLPGPIRASLARFGHVSRELQRYLVIKTLMSALVGATAAAWVALLDVNFAILCGLAAFACHFIPNIGAVLAAVPAMVIAFLQYDPAKSVEVAVGYTVLAVVLGGLVEPALLGRRLGLSALTVFLSLIVWGFLWGPLGMFLSVPLTLALKMTLAGSEQWRWAATLLDAVPRPDSPPAVVAGSPTPTDTASVEGSS